MAWPPPTVPRAVLFAPALVVLGGDLAMALGSMLVGGLVQFGLGLMKAGDLVHLILHPVVSGFVSGIGSIIIILLQIPLAVLAGIVDVGGPGGPPPWRSVRIAQEGAARLPPGRLVGAGEHIQIGRCRGRVVDPFAQQRRAVDEVDRQALEFVLVAEVAPQRVVRPQSPDGLEGQRLHPPWAEGGVVVVGRILDVDLHAVAQLAGVLVEGGLEPAVAQHAAAQPVRRQGAHVGDDRAGVEVGRAEQLQRPGGAAAFGQRRAFQHHGAGVSARHPQVGRVGAGVDPAALAQRPAVAGRSLGLPAFHVDHPAVDVELQCGDEPARQFAHRQAVAHRQGAGADEAFPAFAQQCAFHRPAGGVGAVQHPDRLAVPGRFFQHVAQRGDEGVDAAAQVLQVDQQHVEAVHHRRGGATDLAVQAEHRDAQQRVGVVGGLHHVVLLVAAQPVLRAEGGRQRDVGQRGQGVERVRQVAGHRGRMGEQGDTLARQWAAQCGVGEQAVETEADRRHHFLPSGSAQVFSISTKLLRAWKSGCSATCCTAQYSSSPSLRSITAARPISSSVPGGTAGRAADGTRASSRAALSSCAKRSSGAASAA
ncbi:sulfate transporter [Thauera sp. 63]|nr:sulfate transporter [Thauera sp. 63]